MRDVPMSARVLSKVYVAFLICIALSKESAAMKGFDIERASGEAP